MSEPQNAHITIITGMSGAGRSTAAHALEDRGWRVIDNLPPQLLPSLVALATYPGSTMNRLAIVVDVRGGVDFSTVATEVEAIRSRVPLRLVFLDATDAALIRRFESVRRPHPLQGRGTILDGIAAERLALAAVREHADVVLDTTDLNIHQLTTLVHETFREDSIPDLTLVIESFGFKNGMPLDADFVADARFLPNPFWSEHLRHETGLNPEVQAFVLGQPDVEQFLAGLVTMLTPVLRGYTRENKRHSTIAVGCTGGKHRSVSIVEELARRLSTVPGVAVTIKHRDLGRE
ncbi:UPF0042 nucleotide-binding protein [Microbacteriaceae bacterium MWH-Ta3]|nr:UPF0042 nucleotide-binding protein [Microbacteriaceae bacterium MWH-Ta3]